MEDILNMSNKEIDRLKVINRGIRLTQVNSIFDSLYYATTNVLSLDRFTPNSLLKKFIEQFPPRYRR
ncbi:MAG: hypothetical protein ABII74_00265, partial [Elusimicrobiota bacterium]